jgi:hypothetical protein
LSLCILTTYSTIRVLKLIHIYNAVIIKLDFFQKFIYFIIQLLNTIRIYNFLHLLRCDFFLCLTWPTKHDAACSPKKFRYFKAQDTNQARE